MTTHSELSTDAYVAEVTRYIESDRTDGWPVILPTVEGVDAMVQSASRPAEEAVGRFASRSQPMTVREVAEVAVMAGCLPAYMPVVLAAFELLLDPALESESMASSADGLNPIVVINGPVRHRISVNSGRNVLGPGFRANASIGRAIQLGLINLAGSTPQSRNRTTLGSAYQYTCVIAESEENIPWLPLQTDFGFQPQDSTVLLLWTQQPRQIQQLVSRDPAELLRAIADELRTLTHFNPADVPVGASGSTYPEKALFMVGHDFQGFVRDTGWTKRHMQEVLVQTIGRRVGDGRAADYRADGRIPSMEADDAWIPFYASPEDALIVGAGAGGGCGQTTAAPVLRWGIRRLPDQATGASAVVIAQPSGATPSRGAAQISVVNRYIDRGLTDGLPVFPPTIDGIATFLAAVGRAADDVVGTFNWRTTPITVKDVAINTLMAGCLPEYMPVVLTAFEMLLEPDMGTSGWGASIGGWAPWILLNGPIRRQLRVNCESNCFGPGARANATIGRAIRLILMNVCGIKPDVVDRSAQGQAYKYTCVFGEDEEHSPWAPLHAEFGFQPHDSTVTVVAGCADPRQTAHTETSRPEAILSAIAEDLATARNYNVTNIHPDEPTREYGFGGSHSIVVLGGGHREALRSAGWSRRQVPEFLWQHVRRTVADLKATGYDFPGRFRPDQQDADLIPLRRGPEDFYLVCSGGPGGHSLSTRTGTIKTRKLPAH
jgi:hypothetical protein